MSRPSSDRVQRCDLIFYSSVSRRCFASRQSIVENYNNNALESSQEAGRVMLSETFNLRKKIQFLNLLSWNWIWASLVMFAATQFRAEQKKKKKKSFSERPDSPDLQHSRFLHKPRGGTAGCVKSFLDHQVHCCSSVLDLKSDPDMSCVSCFSIFIWYQSLRINILPALLYQLPCDSTAFYIYIFSGLLTVEKKPHMSAALSYTTLLTWL